MKKEILIAGLGWIAAGIVSIATWALVFARVICNCLNIPIGTQVMSIYVLCACSNPIGLVYIGLFVIAIGIIILRYNKNLENAMSVYEKPARKGRGRR